MWERRLDRYLELGELAGAVNAPGNDVFASRDTAHELERLKQAEERFSSHIARLREDLLLNVEKNLAASILADMAASEQAMSEMAVESRLVFADIERKDSERAGHRMAQMDRKYQNLNQTLTQMRADISAIQSSLLEQQRQTAGKLQSREYLMAAAVFVMLVAAALYGHKIKQRMERADNEREHYIKELKATEAALREARDGLEMHVQERTSELAQANSSLQNEVAERIRAQRELQNYATRLERSNRELQDFAHVASHDLQEPLRKVQAFGDRLVKKYREDLPEEARGYVDRMQNATARMQTLIEDLLIFSRVTTKTAPFQPMSLQEVAQGVVSDLEIRIEQAQGRVEIGALPEVEADALQMRQLLQNLVGNALKFRRADTPPVVKIYSQPIATGLFNGGCLTGSSEECSILIEDNGIGFEEKYLDRIFTVFQRLHGRGEYEGSGVGLAVCRKIVERHNGNITARSTPGQGTTFIITLPLKQSETITHA
jgi:signal transduction histidine kinase